MLMVVLEEIELARAGFLKYTREAFLRLPHQERLKILDIGCGSGIPTIELAKLSNGEVIGIDIDKSCIDELNRKIRNEALSNRVEGINLSMFEMKFPDEAFDIIWSEGVIRTIGFDTALKRWRRFLKRNGYLVIHCQTKYVADSLSHIPKHGYNLKETIHLSPDAWWTEFYQPLKEKMSTLLHEYATSSDALQLLRQLQSEIIMVKKNPTNFGSTFYIMKKGQ
jgi:ubiquinone/menaquinone biosynthesis C-methylase UbiE